MLWGALVGDAAALGAHWYYRQEDLKARFPDGIKGFETPTDDHYHAGKQSGEFTMYGDALMLLMQSISETGTFSRDDFGKRFMTTLTPGSYAGYLDHATKESHSIYLTHLAEHPDTPFDFQQGADDNQLAGATSLMPLVALFHDDSSLLERIEEFVRIRQNNDEAVASSQLHASILKHLLSGESPEQAIEQARADAQNDDATGVILDTRMIAAMEALGASDFIATTKDLGYSCPLPGSLPASVYSFLELKEESYEDAILAIIGAGGESAGRSMLVGAWLGAHFGEGYIPDDWKQKIADYDEAAALIDQIAAM